MGRSWHVKGALGTGPFAPLLAEQRWEGGQRRVVLGRPATEAARPLSRVHHPRLVGEIDVVTLQGKTLGVRPYVPGRTVGQLLDARPEGLGARALASLAAQTIEALRAAPVGHGALSPSCVCVSADGWVSLVGFTGREADDLEVLSDLCGSWGELDDDLLDAIREGRSEDLTGASLEGVDLAELVTSADPVLHPHAWTGQTLTEAQSAPGQHDKVRTAAFAAVTLALGFAAGWMYRP